MGEGDSLKTFASFPDLTEATPPSWQARADELEPRQEMVPGLSMLTGMVAIVGFGILALFMWRSGIREPQVGLVADILTEPPDDLPAGLVGTLVNESFGDKDMMGMLLDLDRRGILQLSEDRVSKKKKADDPERFNIHLMQAVGDVPAWARPMLVGLFGEDAEVGDRVTFSELKKLAEHHRGYMSEAAEVELLEHGFFDEMPGKTRMRWILRSVTALVIAAIPVAAIAIWTMQFSGWLIAVSILIVVLFVGLAIMTTKSARKSMAGAEAAAKWRAFGRYLQQMEDEMEPADRLVLFDRYLPWATTLGFDQASWKRWMEDEDYQWGSHQYRPWDPEWQRRHDRVYGNRRSMSTTSSGKGVSFDPQSMSDRTMSGVNTANLSMFAMLNAAAGTFKTESSSSGSGSGSSSSGSSGGGGHSFS
jgi:uncharacterized membrane protein YgcG